ncbi:hypothetical protein [Curtobacterium flaccumfaciens]|uniref:hypothetical protein n=1 Tax=Curtobacterium flaccumfaciens TaxID=2035 RepID=UPI001BDE7995|nr:hypothetical protein [Curtobacterium flaccumfaciens]MBT1674540.1 hypothetical protein [Curtobacterium flaccumfaciens pv. flaccumfaciens]
MSARVNPVDHPALVDVFVLLVVAAHFVATQLTWFPDLWAPLVASDASAQAGLYLGFFGAAALVSSFAGVVVIFGVTPQTFRFQKFRVDGGKSLARNWSWTSAAGFLGAGLALAAAIAALSGGQWLAPWFLELAIGLVTHSAVRLVLLLHALVGIVRRDDLTAVRNAAQRPPSEAPWRQDS